MCCSAVTASAVTASAAGLDVQDVSDDLVVALVQLLVHLTQLASCDQLQFLN